MAVMIQATIVVIASGTAVGVLTLSLVPLLHWLGMDVTYETLRAGWTILLALAVASVFALIVFAIHKTRGLLRKVKKPKTDNLLIAFLKAKKAKVCPLISFK